MTHQWDAIWDRKGREETADPFELSGFEHFRDVDTESAAEKLIKLLNVSREDSLLEVGAGGGLIGRHLQHHCHYVASDRSRDIVRQSIKINGFEAVTCAANDLIFKDNSFDHVIAFGVFHYFPDRNYVEKTMSEMQRVARKTVCISDLPKVSHDPTHLLFDESAFPNWQLSGSLYPREHERFTVTLYLNKNL